MTSNINYLSINENFPVPGQDNDTQVFRDNFNTIKTSLQAAKDEITDLQNNTAKINNDNDFELNIVRNAVVQEIRDQKYPAAGPGTYITGSGVDWQNGPYQMWIIDTPSTMTFENLPGDPNYTSETTPIGVGKLTLELYSDGSSRALSFSTVGGTIIKSLGFPGYSSGGNPVLTLTSADDPVIIEVWRHSQETIYMRYIGQFA